MTNTECCAQRVRLEAEAIIKEWEAAGIKWKDQKGAFGEPGERIIGPRIPADAHGPARYPEYWRPK